MEKKEKISAETHRFVATPESIAQLGRYRGSKREIEVDYDPNDTTEYSLSPNSGTEDIVIQTALAHVRAHRQESNFLQSLEIAIKLSLNNPAEISQISTRNNGNSIIIYYQNKIEKFEITIKISN